MLPAAQCDPVVLGFRRGDRLPADVAGAPCIDLGQTRDARLLQRALAVARNLLRPQRLLAGAAGAEVIIGRGSFTDSFPLFGLRLEDYDELFAENLDLLLKIRENEHVHWSGTHRAALTGQGVYPRPHQDQLPIWLGVGGTPASFARAGTLGLPLMVAIIGGETRRFRPLVDIYREYGRRAGHSAPVRACRAGA